MSQKLSENQIYAVLAAALEAGEIDPSYVALSKHEQVELVDDLIAQARKLAPVLYAFERAGLQDQQASQTDVLAAQVNANSGIKSQRPEPSPHTAEDMDKSQSEPWRYVHDMGTIYRLGFTRSAAERFQRNDN